MRGDHGDRGDAKRGMCTEVNFYVRWWGGAGVVAYFHNRVPGNNE